MNATGYHANPSAVIGASRGFSMPVRKRRSPALTTPVMGRSTPGPCRMRRLSAVTRSSDPSGRTSLGRANAEASADGAALVPSEGAGASDGDGVSDVDVGGREAVALAEADGIATDPYPRVRSMTARVAATTPRIRTTMTAMTVRECRLGEASGSGWSMPHGDA